MQRKNTKRILIMNPCIPCLGFNPSYPNNKKRKRNSLDDDELRYIDPVVIQLKKRIGRAAEDHDTKKIIALQTLLDLYTDGAITPRDIEKHITKYLSGRRS